MAANENEAPDYWAEEYRRVHNRIREEWVQQREEIAELRTQLAAERRAAERCWKLYEREIAHLKNKLDEKDRILLDGMRTIARYINK
jgi:hypothetical protein